MKLSRSRAMMRKEKFLVVVERIDRVLKFSLAFLLGNLLVFLLWSSPVFPHEPLFGPGARTIWKGGIGLETEFEFEEREKGIGFHTIYGIDEDFSVGGFLVFEGREFKNARENFGVSSRFRFWRYDGRGVQDSGSLNLILSRGSVASGISFAHEARRFYFFSFFLLNFPFEVQKISPFFGGAFGIRPFLTEYYMPDFVLFFEILSGADGVMWGLSAFPSYRNFALRFGFASSFKQPFTQNIFKVSFDVHL